jgi:hypothetical protein
MFAVTAPRNAVTPLKFDPSDSKTPPTNIRNCAGAVNGAFGLVHFIPSFG